MKTGIDLAAIIVTYNSSSYIGKLISSLDRIQSNLYIIVIDNASRDDTCKSARQALAKSLHSGQVICLERNIGFAAAVNIGLRVARRLGAKLALLLNPDTEILDGAPVVHASRILLSSRRLACIGLATRGTGDIIDSAGAFVDPLLYAADLLQGVGLSILERVRRIAGKTYLLTPSACFACALIDLDKAAEIGELRERYFAYFEDLEWGLRAWSKGFAVATLLLPAAWHARGGSSEVAMSPLLRYLIARNGTLTAMLYINPVLFLVRLAAGMLASILTRDKVYLRGIVDALRIRIGKRGTFRLPRNLKPPLRPLFCTLFWLLRYLVRERISLSRARQAALLRAGIEYLKWIMRRRPARMRVEAGRAAKEART